MDGLIEISLNLRIIFLQDQQLCMNNPIRYRTMQEP